MAVTVKKAGQHSFATEIDDFGGIALHGKGLILGPGKNDRSILYRERLDIGWHLAGHGENGAVVVDRVCHFLCCRRCVPTNQNSKTSHHCIFHAFYLRNPRIGLIKIKFASY